MSNSSIQFEGLEEILDSFGDMVSQHRVENALFKACAVVERAAKIKAPKGSGELRRSITSKVEDNKGIVYTPLEYAPYVEYGTGLFAENGGRQDVPWIYKDEKGNYHATKGMHPHPYMRPALDENRDRILRILKEGFITND